ncbi:MAG: hypothetical protein AB2L09_11270 [Coriobacteriia bacterium]
MTALTENFNVYGKDGAAIASVVFSDLQYFVDRVGDGRDVTKIVPGLGDAGFISSASEGDESSIIFRKGSRAVSIMTSADASGKKPLSDAQLLQLAQLIASRIQ